MMKVLFIVHKARIHPSVFSVYTARIHPSVSSVYTARIHPSVFSVYTARIHPSVFSVYTARIHPSVFSVYTARIHSSEFSVYTARTCGLMHGLCSLCTQKVCSFAMYTVIVSAPDDILLFQGPPGNIGDPGEKGDRVSRPSNIIRCACIHHMFMPVISPMRMCQSQTTVL